MIEPDDKDWTWVLDRRCSDCGFDASTCTPESVAALVRENAGAWKELWIGDGIRPSRSDPTAWSSLEYACHVRDVYLRYGERIDLMQREDDPLFPNWDQDATAVSDDYDNQDPAQVIDELVRAADALARQLDTLDDTQWARPGRRSDGASFTIGSIARYMIHDPVHHLWDVSSQG